MSPHVSIIIPTKNRPGYLKQALDSVYAQTYQDFEILVVDDGSTDDTRSAVLGYDRRLRYFYQKPQGVSAARNHGIRQAYGEYIAFLDDDDCYRPDKLQASINYLEAHPKLVWLCNGFSFIDADGKEMDGTIFMPPASISLHEIALFEFIHTSSVVVRRDALLEVGGFPEGVTVSEDYHVWAAVMTLGKGVTLPTALTLFRQHGGNTRLPPLRMFHENLRIIDKILATGAAELASRGDYIENLYRIILDNLKRDGKPIRHFGFRLLQKIGYPFSF